MSTSDSKVVVDHVSDLSSTKKPILFLSLPVPPDWPSSWSRNSGWSYSKQKQISRPAFKIPEIFTLNWSRRLKFHTLNWPSPLLWSIALPPRENRNQKLPGFWFFIFQHETLKVLGIYRTEAPIFAIFAVHPKNSVEFPLVRKNSWWTAFLQTSALVSCSQFVLHLSRHVSLYLTALAALGVVEWRIPWWGVCDASIIARGLPTTFPYVPDKFHVSDRRLWSSLNVERGLRTTAG